MRKLKTIVVADATTYDLVRIVLCNDNGVVSEISRKKIWETPKYTLVQLQDIKAINEALAENNMPLMTEDEMEKAVNWMPNAPDLSVAEIQKLSGFKVEKIITYE